jgi:hypothetical protein
MSYTTTITFTIKTDKRPRWQWDIQDYAGETLLNCLAEGCEVEGCTHTIETVKDAPA